MDAGLSDEALVQRYLEGDVKAFEELLQRHSRKIYNFIFRQLGDRQMADDMVQEVFLRVVHRAGSFKGQSKVTTWLFSIARNLCIDQARKHQHRKIVVLDEPIGRGRDEQGGATLLDRAADKAPGQDVATRDARFRRALEASLDELPPEQREVFVLRELQGLKFREIADIVGVPENTIKSRMRYALEALRGHLASFQSTI